MPLSTTDTDAQAASAPAVAERGLGLLYLIAGLLGLVAAVVLLVESIALLKNPDYVPTCSINPILSCGSVMNTPQAAAFGIPNPIIGVAGFTALSMLAVVILTGATIRPWLWTATQASVTFAVIFIHWLIYQSLYVIGALCPYCMLVWVVTIAVFWHTTIHTLQRLHGPAGSRQRETVAVLTDYRGAILTGWYLVIVVLIAHRFWTYWITLIPS